MHRVTGYLKTTCPQNTLGGSYEQIFEPRYRVPRAALTFGHGCLFKENTGSGAATIPDRRRCSAKNRPEIPGFTCEQLWEKRSQKAPPKPEQSVVMAAAWLEIVRFILLTAIG